MATKKIILALTLAFASMSAFAHAKLLAAEPKAASQLGAAPKEIRLRFNEVLEPAFSTIKLVDAAKKDIALPAIAVDKAHADTMYVPLPALAPGDYRVQWSAMTHDGHKVKGEYGFKVN